MGANTTYERMARARDRVGTVLRGKYRVERVLGVGGMATVYAVTHRINAEFAIKILHEELSHRAGIRDRFLREGYIANSVKHRGAVLVVDDDQTEDGAPFLVMEMLHGSDVKALCEYEGGRLDVAAAVDIALQLLDVLSAAHANGVVHRDLKPANLFVTRGGTLKVLDFGIARLRDAANAGSQTSTGTLIGTPAFMAPEQALGRTAEVDARTDLWAVGATLFYMLSGELVHSGPNAQEVTVQAATQTARALASVAPGVSPAIAAVVDRALAFHRQYRWPSARAMRDALRAASLRAQGGADELAVLAAMVDRKSRLLPPPGRPPVREAALEHPTLAMENRPAAPLPARSSHRPTLLSSPTPEDATVISARGAGVTATSGEGEAPATRRHRWILAGGAGLVAVGLAAMVRWNAGKGLERSGMPPTVSSQPVAESQPAPREEELSGPPSVVPASPLPEAVHSPERPLARTQRTRPAASAPGSPPATVVAKPVGSAAPPSACVPKYDLDLQGNKHFKPECFN